MQHISHLASMHHHHNKEKEEEEEKEKEKEKAHQGQDAHSPKRLQEKKNRSIHGSG